MEHSSTENERFWVGVNLLDDPEVPKSLFTPASFTFDGDEAHMRSSNAVDPHVREAMADLLAGLAGDVDRDGAPWAPVRLSELRGLRRAPVVGGRGDAARRRHAVGRDDRRPAAGRGRRTGAGRPGRMPYPGARPVRLVGDGMSGTTPRQWLDRLSKGVMPEHIGQPASFASMLLAYRRDHGLDPKLDAGVWLAWADWSAQHLRLAAAWADVQYALELRPDWAPALALKRQVEARACRMREKPWS